MYWIFDFYLTQVFVMCLACQLNWQNEYNIFFGNLSSLTMVQCVAQISHSKNIFDYLFLLWTRVHLIGLGLVAFGLGLVRFSFGGLGLVKPESLEASL